MEDKNKKEKSPPQWMRDLSDDAEGALDYAFARDGETKDRAAIFVAVQVCPDGTKHVAHDIRGEGHPLAEAAGFLAYNRNLPGIIADAIASALLRRCHKDRERNQPTINLN